MSIGKNEIWHHYSVPRPSGGYLHGWVSEVDELAAMRRLKNDDPVWSAPEVWYHGAFFVNVNRCRLRPHKSFVVAYEQPAAA